MEQCQLFQGPVAVLCQALLAVLALSTLFYKRSREVNKIEFGIWVLNVSKQVLSLSAAHVFAILASIFISYKVHGASECSWYAVIFSVDTILGTFLTYVLHTGLTRLAKWYLIRTNAWFERGQETSSSLMNMSGFQSFCNTLATCGYYGTPPCHRKWAIQAMEWTCCVLYARCLCAVVVYLLGPSLLQGFAEQVDNIFMGHGILQLYTVMILYPLIVNIIQALVQDAILRAKSSENFSYTKIESPGIAMQGYSNG